MSSNRPILEAVRAEGYREGVGQASQVSYDEAYYVGQCDAREETPSRFIWWVLGVLSGTAASVVGVWL